MKSLKERLAVVEKHVKENNVKVMIIGLGSVGAYLLDYLISMNDPAVSIVAVGRDSAKMQTKVNIARVAGLIRGVNKSQIEVEGNVNLEEVDSIVDDLRLKRRGVAKRRPHLGWAEVGEKPQLLAEGEQGPLLRALRTRQSVPLGSAHGAQQYGVRALARDERLVRQTVARSVVRGASY